MTIDILVDKDKLHKLLKVAVILKTKQLFLMTFSCKITGGNIVYGYK